MAGNSTNGVSQFKKTTVNRRFKTRTAADIQKIADAREARLKGTPEQRASLKSGSLFRLKCHVKSADVIDGFDVLVKATPAHVDANHPQAWSPGAVVIMCRAERINDRDGPSVIRRACYTFLVMGSTKRCVITDLSILEPL